MKGLSFSALLWALLASTAAWGEMQFRNYAEYCEIISQTSSTTLAARRGGMSKAEAAALLDGMTDPLAIRLVKESIEFAWSQPTTMSVDALRAELKRKCLAKEIFVQ